MNETWYKIHEIYSCIQGEGCNTGIPMILIRFWGCNLSCPWCDTQQPKSPVFILSSEMILKKIKTIKQHGNKGIKWVLLTGGEPTVQNLSILTSFLKKNGFKIAIETNGTGEGWKGGIFNWITISPKLDNEHHTIQNKLLQKCDELKFVISNEGDIKKIERFLLSHIKHLTKKAPTVCLQPMSTMESAIDLCITKAKEEGWRLSLQTQKMINQP